MSLSFKRFGPRYVVVGPVDAIERACQSGTATVSLKSGETKTVKVAERYTTKAGKLTWTFDGAETAAFVPVDDRPAKTTTRGKRSAKVDAVTNAAPSAPTDPAPDVAAMIAAAVAEALKAHGVGAPAPADPAPAPAPADPPADPAPAPADDEGCQVCGSTKGRRVVHRGAAQHGYTLSVCHSCKATDPDTAIMRAKRRGNVA